MNYHITNHSFGKVLQQRSSRPTWKILPIWRAIAQHRTSPSVSVINRGALLIALCISVASMHSRFEGSLLRLQQAFACPQWNRCIPITLYIESKTGPPLIPCIITFDTAYRSAPKY